MRRTPLIILAVLVVGLTACSEQEAEVPINDRVPAAAAIAEEGEGGDGDGGEAGGDATFESADAVWVAEQLAFTSVPDSIAAGDAVLGLEIIGGLPHNVIFEGFQGDAILVEGPGEGTFAGSVSGLEPGTYTFYCGIVGHRAAGMEGEITVT